MKTQIATALLAGLAAAHSGVWTITFDGNKYPARDARIDDELGAKRIEWHRGQKMKGNPWNPVTNVETPAITCGRSPTPPELAAVARAGSNVTISWSGMIKMHNGPVMTYLGALPSPDTKPQDVSFFKIKEGGYDPKTQQWENEKLIQQGYTDYVQIPSDIKPGRYILRTELVALHSNSMSIPGLGGPQFFTHCFNVDIKGDGTATPSGVKFPGGYKRTDSGVKFNLYLSEAAWNNYVIPGPPKYNGKYESPKGPQPVVSGAERGLFPAEFQVKYDAYKAKLDNYSGQTALMVNKLVPGGKTGIANAKGADSKTLQDFYKNHYAEGPKIDAEFEPLRQEAIKLHLVAGK